uniref:Uncharacterized protein n=1 Tax=Lotharella oceanica TaxID=641309 RepID=A0A7S2TLI9_9EUKA
MTPQDVCLLPAHEISQAMSPTRSQLHHGRRRRRRRGALARGGSSGSSGAGVSETEPRAARKSPSGLGRETGAARQCGGGFFVLFVAMVIVVSFPFVVDVDQAIVVHTPPAVSAPQPFPSFRLVDRTRCFPPTTIAAG